MVSTELVLVLDTRACRELVPHSRDESNFRGTALATRITDTFEHGEIRLGQMGIENSVEIQNIVD